MNDTRILTIAAESEQSNQGPNTKLLAHLIDLAFEKAPADPGNPAFRHGGTLGEDRKTWFARMRIRSAHMEARPTR